MLTHQAYLDALRSTRSTTAEWRAILAGFLVLRLVDARLDEHGPLVAKDTEAIRAVREALAGVREQDPVLPLLRELADIATQAEHLAVSSIALPALTYGRRLSARSYWTLAMDVFASLLSHALALQADTTIIDAAAGLGYAFKETGNLDASSNAYAVILQRTSSTHRPESYFRARNLLSQNIILHGSLKEAEDILNTDFRAAKELGLTESCGRALHGLSCLALLRGDYHTAVQVGLAGLKYISDPDGRSRLLVNIGGAFMGYGEHRTAKQILLAELDRSSDDAICHRSLINLLELAAKDADQTAFHRYRQQLDGAIVLPELQAEYHQYVAKGYYILGDLAAAHEGWQTALSIASASGLTQTSRNIKAEMTTMGQSLHGQGDDRNMGLGG